MGNFFMKYFSKKLLLLKRSHQQVEIKAGGYKFNQCGRFEKTDFCSVRLEKLTPEMKSKLLLNTERERLEAKTKIVVDKIDISKLSNEKLERLYTFLKEITD